MRFREIQSGVERLLSDWLDASGPLTLVGSGSTPTRK
jgi:hypothetical protein